MATAFSSLDSRLKLSTGRVVALVIVVGVAGLILSRSPLLRRASSSPGGDGIFSNVLQRSYLQHWRSCLNVRSQPDFYELKALLASWAKSSDPLCHQLLTQFYEIYAFESREGSVEVLPVFRKKVSRWLQGDARLLADLKHQVVFSVFNKYTHESTLFSKLRSRRPGLRGAGDPRKYADKLIQDSAKECDFCRYQEMTAFDSFGRIESTHAVAVSNVFKYEAYHGLILLKKHDALSFSQEQFMDMMSVWLRWCRKAHGVNARFRFPNLNWDMLPKASASQIHPHGQAALAPSHSYGLMEHIRLAAVDYANRHGNHLNYFTTLQELHNVLGLSVSIGKATAMAYLTPKKDFEMVIMAAQPDDDFFRAIYHVLRTFIDDMQLVAYSMAIYLPPVDHWGTAHAADIPAIARIVSRGSVSSARSDISAMELFGASQVNQNPYEVIGLLRKRLAG